MITSENIRTSLMPAIKKSFRTKQNELIRLHNTHLNKYELIIKQFYSEYDKQDPNNKTYRYLWNSAYKIIGQQEEWIKSVSYVNDDFTPTVFWSDWHINFQSVLNDLPETVQLEIKDDIKNNDFNRKIIRLFNLYKKLGKKFKKAEEKLQSPSREFNLKSLLQREIEIPVAQLMLSENQRFFQLVTRHLQKLNEIGGLIEDHIFNLNQAKALYRDLVTTLQPGDLSGEHFLIIIKELKKEIRNFKKDSDARIKTEIEKIYLQFNKLWDTAGTFLYSSFRFSKKNIERLKIKLEKSLLQNREAWQSQFDGCLEEWKKDLQIESFQLKTKINCFDANQRLLSKLDTKILTAFKDAENILEMSSKKIDKIEVEEASELKKAIFIENRALLKDLRLEKLPKIMDAIVNTNITSEFEQFVEKIKLSTELFPDEYTAFKYLDTVNLLPQSKLDEVPLKALIKNEIIADILDKQQQFKKKITVDSEDALRRISEIDQIVEFNLEAALNLIRLEEDKENEDIFEKAKQIVMDGLERTNNQIRELKEFFTGLLIETTENVFQSTLEINNDIQILADSENIFKLKIRSAKAQSRQKIINYRNRITRQIKIFFPTFFKLLGNLFRQIQSFYFRLGKIAGFTPIQVKVDEKLSTYLNEIQRKTSQLPYVYQRLFRMEALEDKRFFSGRLIEMEKIESTFRSWKEGANFTLSIVGERGSGKTTLLNFAEMDYLKGFRLIKVELNKTINENELVEILSKSFKAENINTFEELENIIYNLPTKTIFIFENVQNLFIRTINGFDSLEKFLLFISKTQIKVFWMISCSIYAWEYLEKVLKISKYFTKVIYLEAQSNEEMENIILKRHRVSGYNFTFAIPEEAKKIKKFKKLKSDEEKNNFIKERFFKQLAELSAGNIRVAMLFWLSAITAIEKDKLLLSSKIEFDHTFLYNLHSEELFTLAAVIQHENLLQEDHANIFNQSLQKSELLLNRLFNVGLLQKNERGYYVHPFLYRPVVKALKSKNILH